MRYSKKVCQTLKAVRKQIADANEIPYEITECHHEGDCRGTCPKCESELRYIENQLSLRRSAGKAISLVGLSLGISATFASCGNNTQQPANSVPEEAMQETCVEETRMINPSASMSQDSVTNESDADSIVEELIVMGEDYVLDGMIDDECFVDQKPDTSQVYTYAEVLPEFPGGDNALMDFIKKNLKYPEFATETFVNGRVFLSFIIERDGSISDIEVLRSPAEELSVEAVNLVKSMPKWNPGKIQEIPVSVRYVLPINFRLK